MQQIIFFVLQIFFLSEHSVTYYRFSFFFFLNHQYCHPIGTECRRTSVDIFLKAAGYLDYAVCNVISQLSDEMRLESFTCLLQLHYSPITLYCSFLSKCSDNYSLFQEKFASRPIWRSYTGSFSTGIGSGSCTIQLIFFMYSSHYWLDIFIQVNCFPLFHSPKSNLYYKIQMTVKVCYSSEGYLQLPASEMMRYHTHTHIHTYTHTHKLFMIILV